ncbi:MAG: YfdX family protein [Methylococcales bacterium]|nr:YfdX family protein [Methylococcales bacterium]
MKIQNLKIRAALGTAAIPLLFSLPLAAIAADNANATPPTTANHALTTPLKDNSVGKQVAREAADAAMATQTALKALTNNQPKQALAALQVASGNLHLLLSRDPALGMVPIDIKIQVLEGPTDLKVIKRLKNELEDLIGDERLQDARPILDSLVDEVRVTVVSLPMGTYPAAIDRAAPLIDAGNLSEAKQELIKALDALVYEQDITPLSIIRAEDRLNLAFEIEHRQDLSKQDTKDKISELVAGANYDINVAEALGYGTKKDFALLYDGMDALDKAIGSSGFEGEWQKIKNELSALKNRIVHPAG